MASKKLTETQNVYSGNYIILLKEIKSSLRKCEDIPHSCIRRINVAKMAIFPRSMYRFNVIPIEISPDFFA